MFLGRFQHTYEGSKPTLHHPRSIRRPRVPAYLRGFETASENQHTSAYSTVPAYLRGFETSTFLEALQGQGLSSSIPTRVRNMWARMLTKGTEAGSSIPTRVRNTFRHADPSGYYPMFQHTYEGSKRRAYITRQPEYIVFQHTYEGSKPIRTPSRIADQGAFQHTYEGSKHSIQSNVVSMPTRSSIPTRVRNERVRESTMRLLKVPAYLRGFETCYLFISLFQSL